MFAQGAYAFFEYADHAVTDQAVAALHGMKIGDKSLIVQRSSSGGPASAVPAVPSDAAAAHPGAAACLSLQIPLVSILQSLPDIDRNAEPSAMLVLVNLFRPKDLAAEEDYLDALAEVRGEMEQFGKLLDLQIVRPRADIDPATAQLEGTKVRVFLLFLVVVSGVCRRRTCGRRATAASPFASTRRWPRRRRRKRPFRAAASTAASSSPSSPRAAALRANENEKRG